MWRPANGTSKSDLGYTVRCVRDENNGFHLSLLPCYCVTQYGNTSSAVVGLCQYTCTEKLPLLNYISLPANNVSTLSDAMCKNFSRRGQMCGQCKTGYALAAYSYTLNCVNCTQYRMNWLKYVGAAFGPQTLFFVMTFISRMSVTSGLMVGYVTVSQVVATGIELRFKASELRSDSEIDIDKDNPGVKFLATVYGIWNLDFFRSFYTPFCLHPEVPPLAIISLDYAVALYPMVLIAIAYFALTLCDKHKPFFAPCHRLMRRCYKECEIRDSVIDAFITAMILSYVKILNISFELLLPARLMDQNGVWIETVVYYRGDLKYFREEHLPYAILAIFMFLTFNILPLVVLTLYPCPCFQQCLNKCWKSPRIHNAMDDFYKSYKTTPRDYRYFGAVYLYLRLINLSLLLVALSPVYLTLVSILYLSMALLIALVRPHKVTLHNIINAVLFFIIAVTKILEQSLQFSLGVYEDAVFEMYSKTALFLFTVPPLYGLFILLYHLFPKRVCGKVILRKLFLRLGNKNDESFPHRVSHADEYTRLLNVNN